MRTTLNIDDRILEKAAEKKLRVKASDGMRKAFIQKHSWASRAESMHAVLERSCSHSRRERHENSSAESREKREAYIKNLESLIESNLVDLRLYRRLSSGIVFKFMSRYLSIRDGFLFPPGSIQRKAVTRILNFMRKRKI